MNWKSRCSVGLARGRHQSTSPQRGWRPSSHPTTYPSTKTPTSSGCWTSREQQLQKDSLKRSHCAQSLRKPQSHRSCRCWAILHHIKCKRWFNASQEMQTKKSSYPKSLLLRVKSNPKVKWMSQLFYLHFRHSFASGSQNHQNYLLTIKRLSSVK